MPLGSYGCLLHLHLHQRVGGQRSVDAELPAFAGPASAAISVLNQPVVAWLTLHLELLIVVIFPFSMSIICRVPKSGPQRSCFFQPKR